MRRSLLFFVLAACNGSVISNPPPPQFPFTIRVESDPGVPLAGASMLRRGEPIGTTGADGKFSSVFQGTEGDMAEITIRCPAGYISPNKPIYVPLRRTSDSRAPEFATSCPPTVRKVVLVVRADNGPFVPIVYHGEVIGRTDKSGSATFLANLPPNDKIELTLQTSNDKAFARHVPVDPTLTFAVGPSDEVVVLNQSFTIAAAPVPYQKPKDKPKQF